MTLVRAFANCDHALIAWRPLSIATTARGFALFRHYLDGTDGDEPVGNWTGWETRRSREERSSPARTGRFTVAVGRLPCRASASRAIPSCRDERPERTPNAGPPLCLEQRG